MSAPKAPIIMAKGQTVRMNTACGSIFLTHNPTIQCFVTKGKSGTCLNSMCEAIGRLASKLIEKGETEEVINQLIGIRCGNDVVFGLNEKGEQKFIVSCADAIGQGLNLTKGE